MTNVKYTPGPWLLVHYSNYKGFSISSEKDERFGCIAERWEDKATDGRLEVVLANGRLISACPDLLAFAECSAALDCARADPDYDPQPVLRGHGWSEQENPGVFLARIRRDALNKAVGHYLGREAP